MRNYFRDCPWKRRWRNCAIDRDCG